MSLLPLFAPKTRLKRISLHVFKIQYLSRSQVRVKCSTLCIISMRKSVCRARQVNVNSRLTISKNNQPQQGRDLIDSINTSKICLKKNWTNYSSLFSYFILNIFYRNFKDSSSISNQISRPFTYKIGNDSFKYYSRLSAI